ncbi:MAG: hypothetical protein ACM3MK_11590 [Chitinophagales bacterium]
MARGTDSIIVNWEDAYLDYMEETGRSVGEVEPISTEELNAYWINSMEEEESTEMCADWSRNIMDYYEDMNPEAFEVRPMTVEELNDIYCKVLNREKTKAQVFPIEMYIVRRKLATEKVTA